MDMIKPMEEAEFAELIELLQRYRDIQPVPTAHLTATLEEVENFARRMNPCPYTMSHTRDWCGHPLCRAS